MNEKLVIIFFWLAFLMYSGAFVLYGYYFVSKKSTMGTLATLVTAAGLLFQSISSIARWQSTGRIPLQGAFESYFVFALTIVAIYLVTERSTDIKVLGTWTMPLVLTLLGIAWYKYESPARLSNIVKNSLIVMHVTVVSLAYAGFSLAAGLAILYMLQKRQLKKHKINLFFRRLPSLEVLDELSNKAVAFGLVFMTMTIVTGIIQAMKKYSYWYFDPVVITSLIAWIIYSFYITARYSWQWHGSKIAYLALIGFAIILLIAFIGPYLSRFA